jgi:hypothetical protein
LGIRCFPSWGQCRRRDAIEVLGKCTEEPTGRTNRRSWGRNGGRNIDASPASNIVWWTGRPALLVGDKVGRVIQRCPTSGNVVTQIWPRTPQQCHGASDMRGRHGRAAESRISIIGRVIAGTSACTRRRDIRFDSVTPIDRYRAAAAKVSNDILARVQRPDRIRRRVNGRGIHYSGTAGTVVARSCHHHYPSGGLSLDSSLQRVSRTTF